MNHIWYKIIGMNKTAPEGGFSMAERMVEIKITEVLPGDVLAANVYSSRGKVLVTKNTVVTDAIILGLRKNFIGSVYVFKDVDQDQTENKVNINNILLEEAEETIDSQVIKYLKKDKNIKEIKKIIIDLLKNDRIIELMLPLRVLGDNLFRHSVCVAAYSVAVGRELFFPQHRLVLLGTAALLHDVGMSKIPKNILSKKGALTAQEKKLIQQHPKIGFEIVKNSGYFSAEVYNIILEHHERYDGTGYPNGLTNEKIHNMAKIIAVCDVYNALTSDRPYRAKHNRSESIEFLLGSGNFYFNYDIVKALINTIVIYKYGQWVELSTGETGVVAEDENQGFTFKPKVMVYFDEEGIQRNEPKLVDLSLRENAKISILRNI